MSSTDFLQNVASTIKKHHLIKTTDKILVTLSGGADSVALLLALKKLNYNCIAVHCNFHLRGDDANADELFVRNLCKKENVYLDVAHFDTTGKAKKEQISIEMAARDLRYDYFYELSQKLECKKIAVAHHEDDSNETMLLNLIRGTGLKGLIGIHYKRGKIIRPLLDCRKNDILVFLKEEKQDYVTDKSNFDIKYKRNKIRHQLIPLLKEFNPSIDQTLKETSNVMTESYKFLQFAIKQAKKRITIIEGSALLCIDCKKLRNEITPHLVLFEVLKPFGFNNIQINQLLTSTSKKKNSQYFSDEYSALFYQGKIYITKNKITEDINIEIALDSNTKISKNQFIETVSLDREELLEIPKEKKCICIDAETIHYPITCRNYHKGDKFIPYGMTGNKLISDYLSDEKIPLFEREQQLLLEDRNHILWLIGERVDNRCAITDATNKVLKIALKEKV